MGEPPAQSQRARSFTRGIIYEAGGGKTIPVSTIINHLKQHARTVVDIAYCYCDCNDPQRKSPVRVFGILLPVLAARNEHALRYLQTVFEEKQKTGAASVPTLKQLSMQYPSYFRKPSSFSTAWVSAISLMNALLSLSQQTQTPIKVLVASRGPASPTKRQCAASRLKNGIWTQIESYITAEIANRIHGQTGRRELSLRDPTLEQTIVT